ncbi:hypothetical protein BDD43_5094 [Mucilaginibacter gracilis]|uniref:Membrane protein YkgB n=1 Tax=Mucilaginibacter gracilis TaxID=423350 RepID=A0A495J7X1_9SPHI|nr:hypothetical protein [Mucilaginibacter gracilis]RKR84841.1 hypothetical protein BDD43_5094 [Mucilaginibacter gracilis]
MSNTSQSANTQNKQKLLKPVTLLRLSIGLIYFWFGILKFFYGFSPAKQIASQTVHHLTFGRLPDHLAITMLAAGECALGILLMGCLWMRATLVLVFIHMLFTFTPFVFFPQATFLHLPYDFTLLGQYIMKNLVIISGTWVLWQQYVQNAPAFYFRDND